MLSREIPNYNKNTNIHFHPLRSTLIVKTRDQFIPQEEYILHLPSSFHEGQMPGMDFLVRFLSPLLRGLCSPASDPSDHAVIKASLATDQLVHGKLISFCCC